MEEGVFVILLLGFIWVLFASIHDWRKKEVANWLNFSLITFTIGFRFFYSLYDGEWNFFIQGLAGIAVFLLLGNLFYYSRIFAGGDAKLMIALGGVLFFSNSFYENIYYSEVAHKARRESLNGYVKRIHSQIGFT
jgi:Flp pilus assembly protein protease CpaA